MWACPKCDYINEDSRPACDGCLARYDTFRITLKPNYNIEDYDYDIEHNIFLLRCNRLDYLIGIRREGENIMTPQEELFAGFFRDEKVLVKDMGILELRAHREELAKIAFEARARLTAVDDEERDRKAKARKDGKPTGFSTSLQTDELTTNAINKIKERQRKLTKQEKLLEGMKKLGIDSRDAEKIMSAGSILARVRQSEAQKNAEPEPARNFLNPFAPKDTAEAVEVTIVEETNTVIVTKSESEPEPEKTTGFVNPFAK